MTALELFNNLVGPPGLVAMVAALTWRVRGLERGELERKVRLTKLEQRVAIVELNHQVLPFPNITPPRGAKR